MSLPADARFDDGILENTSVIDVSRRNLRGRVRVELKICERAAGADHEGLLNARPAVMWPFRTPPCWQAVCQPERHE